MYIFDTRMTLLPGAGLRVYEPSIVFEFAIAARIKSIRSCSWFIVNSFTLLNEDIVRIGRHPSESILPRNQKSRIISKILPSDATQMLLTFL